MEAADQDLYVVPGGPRRTLLAAALAPAVDPSTFSHWHHEVRDRHGELKYVDPEWRSNLTTDSASGYTNRRDWQSKIMAGGLNAFFGASAASFATSTDATHLNNTGAAFPTTNQGLQGCYVAAGPNNAGAGSIRIGIINANTATQVTVDQWYDPTTGASGSTPNGTCSYVIIPGNAPAYFLAVSTDSTAPAASDTSLASELTTNGFSRAAGTFAHTAAASTYTLSHTWTASGTDTIQKEAVVGAATQTAGGVMPFESAEPNAPTLVSGDTIQNTVTITIG